MFRPMRLALSVGTVLAAVMAAATWPATEAAASDSVPAHYRVVNLGNLGGTSNGVANALNDRGEVVGVSTTASGYMHPFLWRDGVMRDLGLLDNSPLGYGAAYDINNRGEVVGVSFAGTSTEHAFLWRNGRMIDLGTLGGSFSAAWSINDRGEVVGVSLTATDEYHGFLWADGVMTDLGVAAANAINDRGQVTGRMTVAGGDHAYRWDRGTFTDLGTVGGNFSEGIAINKAGWVVGAGAGVAFLWRNGVMTALYDLGRGYSTAIELNDHGLVLGLATGIPAGPYSYVIWDRHSVIDLAERGIVSDVMGSGTSRLTDINNKAQLVGSYYFAANQQGAALFTR